ncbi:MAG: InlB B-repeat-containing protein, partial [Treponemataceae bacterium]|nr:InlB B-repeat-containing protein [Treponemataceae bacterium]
MKKFVPLLILAAVLFALLGCPSEPKQPKTKTFKVSYVSEYGPAPEQKTVKENYALTQADLAPLSSEAAANAHKVFQGWFIDSSIPANPGDKITRNTTLVARWKSQQFTVTYTTLYGTAPDSITLDYGTALTAEELPVLQNDSHTFTGWFANGTEVKTGFAVKENLTLTASWDKTKRTVSFIDEKHPDTNPITVLHGETASLSAPANVPGYDFKGWFAGATQITSSTPITSDITLTAKWEIQQFTVTYATSYGTAPDSITVDYGTPLTAEEIPVLTAEAEEHKQHNGWTSDGTTICKAGDLITENTVLTAKWGPEQLKLTVSTSVEGFPESIDVNFGSKIKDVISSEELNPTLQHYELLGWKIDNVYYQLTYAGDAVIESPKTAVPQFKIIDNAFQSSTITEYTVPEGVREIGAYAFAGSKIA